MSAPRIPPLLEPYLAGPLPRGALVLLTGVLGARTNWLVVRFLYALLRGHVGAASKPGEGSEQDGDREGQTGVVLLSLMRDESFWKDMAGKMGLDLDAMARRGAFAYVNGLTRLFAPSYATPSPAGFAVCTAPGTDALDRLVAAVDAALAQLRGARRVLIIDQPDFLLAAGGDAMTARRMHDALLTLRERVHASIFVVAADDPLIHTLETTLERHHAAFVLSLAHAARTVLSLRPLDTGAARDVSGVVRVSHRLDDDFDYAYGDNLDEQGVKDSESSSRDDAPAHADLLYHVAGDGTVKVFERGA